MMGCEQVKLHPPDAAVTKRTTYATLHSIEVIRSSRRFLQLKPAWDDLWSRAGGDGLFQSFDCCWHAWRLMAKHARRRLFCLASWRGDSLVAVWPLVLCRRGPWSFLRPLDASGAESARVLFDPTVDQELWLATAGHVIRTKAPCSLVVLPYLVKNSMLQQCVASWSGKATVDAHVSVHLHLRNEKDWSSYFDSLSKTHLKQQCKLERKLREQGTLRFEVVEAGDARSAYLIEWMLRQKRIWAKKVGKQGSWLFCPRYEAFLKQLLASAGGQVRCLLFVLTLNDRPLAIKLAAVGRSLSEALIGAFDADYEKYSPGVRLDEYFVRWTLEQKLDCDLGAGGERSKQFWSRNQVVEVLSYQIPLSLSGELYLAIQQRGRACKRYLQERWRRGALRPHSNQPVLSC